MNHAQPKFTSEVLHAVVLPAWSLDEVMLSGGVFTLGTVAACVDGKAVVLDATSDEGAAQAALVVLTEADATDSDRKGTAAARGAVLLTSGLVWPEGISAQRKALALAALAERGLVARAGLAGPDTLAD